MQTLEEKIQKVKMKKSRIDNKKNRTVFDFSHTGYSSFDELYKEMFPKLFRYVRSHFDHSLSEDIVQDIFFKIIKYINSFEKETNFTAWAFTIAKRECMDHTYRSKNKIFETKRNYDSGKHIEDLSSLAENQEELLLFLEQKKILHDAIELLPQKTREVASLHIIQGLDYENVACRANKSIGGVKSQIHYAKKLLKLYTKEYFEMYDIAA